jgi:hypothetical protein
MIEQQPKNGLALAFGAAQVLGLVMSDGDETFLSNGDQFRPRHGAVFGTSVSGGRFHRCTGNQRVGYRNREKAAIAGRLQSGSFANRGFLR